MSINRIWALALRIVRQFVRDPRTMALLFLVPLFVMGLLTYLIQSPSSSLTLGVAFPAQFPPTFQQRLSSLLEDQQFTVTQVSAATAKELVQNGELNAALVLPDDLLAQFQQKGSPTVRLIVAGTDASTAGRTMAGLARVMQELQTLEPNAPALPQLQAEYVYGGADWSSVDYLAPAFITFFVFFFVFLLSVISFLRERSRGTVERLLVSPLGRGEIVLGYALGFLIFALVQSLIIILFAVYVLGIHYAGSIGLVFLVNFFVILMSVSQGVLLSAFARNELQAIQFIPIVIIPQILLCGFFWPVQQMVPVLRGIAAALPMTYAIQALQDVMVKGNGFGSIWLSLLILTAFIAFFFLLAAFSVRRRSG